MTPISTRSQVRVTCPEVTLLRLTLNVHDRWAVGGVDVTDDGLHLPVLSHPRLDTESPVVPWMPATSLVGSLRRHLGERAKELLGPEPGNREERTGDIPRTPSRLAFLGVRIDPAATVTKYGSTAVDSGRGAAKGGSLRQAQAVAPGPGDAATTLVAAVECPGRLSDTDLADLASWRPAIGRSRSSGMGRAEVIQVDRVELNLREPTHLLWWTTARQQWLETGDGALEGTESEPVSPGWERQDRVTTLGFRVREPLHIGSGDKATRSAGSDVRGEALELLKVPSGPLIPGSSWKGIFRHRVEFILAALGARGSDSIVTWLFGTQNQRGRLVFRDSVLAGVKPVTITHVAIDRFTGGAREGALYQVQAVPRGAPVELAVGWEDVTVPIPEPVLNLLKHVVADLDEGLIGVGGGGSRGYGWLALSDPETWSPPVGVDPTELARLVTWPQAGKEEAL